MNIQVRKMVWWVIYFLALSQVIIFGASWLHWLQASNRYELLLSSTLLMAFLVMTTSSLWEAARGEKPRNVLTLHRSNVPAYTIPLFPRGEYVYVIQDIDITGYCKIGKTTHPAKRLRRFEVILPFRYRVLCVLACDNALALEAELHKHFWSKHVRGEWFALDAADVAWIDQQGESQS